MYRRLLVPLTLGATALASLSPLAAHARAGAATSGAGGFVSTHTKATPQLINTNGTHALDLGALPGSTTMNIVVGLALRNRAALDQYIHDIGTPGNARYGQSLTPAQFTATYGPTSARVQAVTTYLTDKGLTGVQAAPNNLLITARGTATQVEAAFNTSIDRFRLNGQTVYANTMDAQVPSSLGGTVVAVLGLNNASRMSTPLHRKVTVGTTATTVRTGVQPAVGTPAPPITAINLNGFHPPEYAKIYDAAGVSTGISTTIAVFAEGDLTQVERDLRTEEISDSVPQVPYEVRVVPTSLQSSDVAGLDEWDLDTQNSAGMAGNVKKLYVYDVGSLSDADVGKEFNQFVVEDLAKVGNASFGECESFPAVDGFMLMGDQIAGQAAAQGQTIFASSGDTGSACAVAPTNGVPGSGLPEPEYPAASPFITGVGGTTLGATNDMPPAGQPADTYITETAWLGGGCGVSDFESQPPWQANNVDVPNGQAPLAATFVMGGRVVPDIAMEADPNTGSLIVVSNTVTQVGGTSLASPLSMGVWARLETSHNNSLGYAAPLLYKLYRPIPQTYQGFHDVPSGTTGGALPCVGTVGYDLATGLGTFDIAQNNAVIGTNGANGGSGGGGPTNTPEPGSSTLYATGIAGLLAATLAWRRRGRRTRNRRAS